MAGEGEPNYVLLFLLKEWDYIIGWSPDLKTPGGEWLDRPVSIH